MSRLLSFAVLASLLFGCSKSEPPKSAAGSAAVAPAAPAKPAAASKDPARAKELIASGAPVIDVRTADEVAGGAIATSKHIPIADFGARVAEVEALVGGDKTKPVVVYCASGGRAGKAKQTLEAAGFTNVVNGGGYDDLQ